MCGITGVFSLNNDIDVNEYYEAHRLIRHRGPDDEGFISFVNGEINHHKGDDTISDFQHLKHIQDIKHAKLILGHRRLSIIDLSKSGHQPFYFENYFMVYNGEIYNYIEIRKELISLGYYFETNTDTEVVLKAYCEWGENAFPKFNGMWALSIFDYKKNEIFFSRDRFGIKPLYICKIENTIYFSSEIKFIKKMVVGKLSLNEENVTLWINHNKMNFSKQTFYDQIEEVLPGKTLRISRNKFIEKSYWELKIDHINQSEAEALDNFKQLFNDSIKLRMRSDVEVGGLLSGGLDSSLILCDLNELGLINNGNYKAFSAVFEDKKISEKSYVDDLNRKFNYKQYFIYSKPDDLINHMEEILFYMDEPFRPPNLLQFMIYKTVMEQTKVKVLLNGQGSDELFGGYNVHYDTLFVQHLSNGSFYKSINEARLFKKYRQADKRFLNRKNLLEAFKNIGNKKYFNNVTSKELSDIHLRTYLKEEDRMSMAFGLESRLPFLDYRLVEFAFTLPPSLKINNFKNKFLVRQYASLKSSVPRSITGRRDKKGFVTPITNWQTNDLKDEFDQVFIEIKNHGLCSFINEKEVLKKYNEFRSGNKAYTNYIWNIFSFMKWKKFI